MSFCASAPLRPCVKSVTQIEGKTPLSRATIEVLRLNRPGVVNLRRVLVAGGLHPPPEPWIFGADP